MAKVNYKLGDKTFINPYNFVGMDVTRKAKPCEATDDVLTGVIKCKILTKTPLAVPNVAEAKNKNGEHPKYDCMKNPEGTPIIPSSSLRGTIRSVYETATNSCFSTTDNNSYITSRSNAYYKSGVLKLEGGNWHLYSADDFRFKTNYYSPGVDENGSYIIVNDDKIYSGSEVRFNTKETQKRNAKPYAELNKNGMKGILVLGEKISNKKSEKIFSIKDDLRIDLKLLDKSIKGLEETLEIYRDKAINKNYEKNHNGYPTYERMKKNGCIPVWYKSDHGKLYLSLACRGRVAYNTTVCDMLEELQPCCTINDLCKSCTLFGMIGENQAKSSMIRFTDAVCISDNPYKGYYTLQELASPKTSYIPFYADIDKYDARNPVDYDCAITIRGRKFYWHSTDYMSHIRKKNNINNTSIPTTIRNATINLIDVNKEFTFNVYFDKISKEQLDELVWALNFGENNQDSSLCHKLCHGKPLGLGSAKITVESIETRSFDDSGYKVNSYTDVHIPDFVEENADIVGELKAICTFTKREVCYPFISNPKDLNVRDNDKAAHKWFTENKNGRIGGRNWDIQLLPSTQDINNGTNTLRSIEIANVEQNNRKGNNGNWNRNWKKYNNYRK